MAAACCRERVVRRRWRLCQRPANDFAHVRRQVGARLQFAQRRSGVCLSLRIEAAPAVEAAGQARQRSKRRVRRAATCGLKRSISAIRLARKR
ncbi:MAG: hypothetical protein AW12_01278 [Candidatus Accumulibacter sp. BA-94]|nr:MAG: hypothetical protein AW12_01278 [Candidatus Accumulibacter sp. BA-94]